MKKNLAISIMFFASCILHLQAVAQCDAVPDVGFAMNNPSTGNPVKFTDNTTFDAGTINMWIWNFGDGATSTEQNPVHIYESQGLYIVSLDVQTTDGCIASHITTLVIYDMPLASAAAENPVQVHVPEIFTPNNDYANDVWQPVLKGVEKAEGRIYNESGMLIADFSETTTTWDGKTKAGSDVPEGTYFYVLDYTTTAGVTDKKGGMITVLR